MKRCWWLQLIIMVMLMFLRWFRCPKCWGSASLEVIRNDFFFNLKKKKLCCPNRNFSRMKFGSRLSPRGKPAGTESRYPILTNLKCGAYRQRVSTTLIFDSEKLSQICLVLRTGGIRTLDLWIRVRRSTNWATPSPRCDVVIRNYNNGEMLMFLRWSLCLKF